MSEKDTRVNLLWPVSARVEPGGGGGVGGVEQHRDKG